jgi:hypothetical protein
MRPIAAGFGAMLLLIGCSAPTTPGKGEDGQTSEDVPSTRATLDPKWRGTMTVSPASAAPGQQIALRFTSERVRGIAYSLAAWSEEGWNVAYYLTSDWGAPGRHSPDWWSPEEDDRGWVDIGVSGAGPDNVVVPDSAGPGAYLLCTANSAAEACALLTVTS